MYVENNYANQNPLVNQFNRFNLNNPNNIPFQNNQLINNNVHVMNHLNNYVQNYRPGYYTTSHINNIQQQPEPLYYNNGQKKKNINIIEEMLKPQKISKNNNDVELSYTKRKLLQDELKNGKFMFALSNQPYKNILKDKIIQKNVEDITEDDIIVHKINKEIDANRKRFDEELQHKMEEKQKINYELEIEFHVDNYDRHKKNFEYKESFIKNLAYEENTIVDSKRDLIEFYREEQRKAEEGIKICDQIKILLDMDKSGIINEDEIPDFDDDIQKK